MPFRILVLSVRGFLEDKVELRASALTYYSLWAVIPILALVLGLARGFGFQSYLEEQIISNFGNQTITSTTDSGINGETTVTSNLAEHILDFAYRYLDKTDEGFILGVGIFILLWSVINMLGQIENTFNHIWRISTPRSWLRKYTDYFGFLIIFPVIFMVSSSANVFLTTHLENMFTRLGLDIMAKPVLLFMAYLTPYVLYSLIFFLFYIVIPNTKVKLIPALIAGIIVGISFQLLQYFYFNGQVYFSRLNAVYGTFVALPLFLMFLQLSWVLVLYGAEFAFAMQNHRNFLYDSDIKNMSSHYRKTILFYVLYLIIQRFKNSEPALIASDVADANNIPVRLIRSITTDLVKAGLVSEVNLGDEVGYQPAVDIDLLTIQYVKSKLEKLGSNDFLPLEKEAFHKLTQILGDAEEKFSESAENICIKDLNIA